MRKSLLLILILSIISCQSEIDRIKKSNNLEECIEKVTTHINNCHEGSNQIEVDEKAHFDFETNILTIYKGKSITDYFQKWEIPLARLSQDAFSVVKESELTEKITVFIENELREIRYFENGELKSKVFQNNYYLAEYCFEKENDKEIFIESYKRAIYLAKKN